ncbi:uncharacterized protein BCR38DRAFT_480682 [Pseudomassariella vexata]|uniref:FUN14 family-domain-containing protein n=1 Tax=Pseudomassariella vexata TaxID=1141098 RepID=A0A1Y2EFB9_9PEZI|nr:uncharacterized protein BCR38DRAFT_480682 [Pseudomassariella vexata]ORY69495.1 hypothetical protein BCR38DRAFT_480682 [Pseudomassariella vexata]
MSALLMSRTALRRSALGAGISLSIGSAMVLTQPKLRMDTLATSRATISTKSGPSKERLDPDVIKQLSSGSMTGFLAGLLVSVFSKALVLLMGVSFVLVQVAASYGVDLIGQLRMKQQLQESKVLAALRKNPTFKVSFGLFFAASAFMSF